MTLQEILLTHKDSIVKEWVSQIFATYPIDTVGFLRRNEDMFNNPVGERTKRAVQTIYDALCVDVLESEAVTPALEEFIRVRSIQNFSAPKAVGCLFFVKTIIRKTCRKEIEENNLWQALLALESEVDSIVLVAFGIYSDCRDKVQLMRVEEKKRGYAQIIRWAQRKGFPVPEDIANGAPFTKM